MGILGSIIEAGGSLLSSAIGYKSARRAEAYQTQMSNTAHQREVQDLIKAGLNPVLSAGGHGASSPMGVQFTPENPVRGYAQASAARSQIKLMEEKLISEKNLIDKQADKTEAEKESVQQRDVIEAARFNDEMESTFAQRNLTSAMEAAERARLPGIGSQRKLTEAQTENLILRTGVEREKAKELEYRLREIAAAASEAESSALLQSLEADLYKGYFGKSLKRGEKIMDMIGKIIPWMGPTREIMRSGKTRYRTRDNYPGGYEESEVFK